MRWAWLHRHCDDHESMLVRERDRVEGALGRLQRQYDELQRAHEGLIGVMAARGQQDTFSKMLNEMFEEVPVQDGEARFLTPTLEEREGLAE